MFHLGFVLVLSIRIVCTGSALGEFGFGVKYTMFSFAVLFFFFKLNIVPCAIQ